MLGWPRIGIFAERHSDDGLLCELNLKLIQCEKSYLEQDLGLALTLFFARICRRPKIVRDSLLPCAAVRWVGE